MIHAKSPAMLRPAALGALLLCLTMPSFAEQPPTSAPLEHLLTIAPGPGHTRNSEGDIIRLSDGKLALVYSRFAGGDDDHSSAVLAMRTSGDEGKTWSDDTVLVANEGGRNVMSVSLRPSQDGGILLFYLRKDSPSTSCTMLVRRSYDDLQTLSEPVTVTTLPGYHVVNNDRVLRLKSGRLLVPAALHTDLETIESPRPGFNAAGALIAYYSDDDGRTWHKDNSPIPPIAERKIVFQEPGLVELADGRIMMYIRTNQGAQFARYSADGGESWTSATATALKSPLSPATIERIPDSKNLVAIWNDHSGRWPYKKEWRNPLCLAISHDNGSTWSPSLLLESNPTGWYCYTSLTWENQNLLLTYCAGPTRQGGLNTLKISRLPVEWVTEN